MKFNLNIDNIAIESIHISPIGSMYVSVDIELKCGNNKISKTSLRYEDLSSDAKEKIEDFLNEIEKALEIDVLRKAKQLPPHLDDSIKAIDGEVS